ncbi:MAG: S1 RNA-binding domain-containing protein [Aggregatilineales bacterium]
MSTDLHRQDYQPLPPALEEGYWESLLNEGESATTNSQSFENIEENYSDTFHENDLSEGYSQSADVDWVEIQRITESDETIELTVVGYNRGGLLVEWRSLHGFVPASQLIDFPTSSTNNRRTNLVERVGQTLRLRVIELHIEKNRLILSERAAQAAPGERAEILTNLQPGDIISGLVTNLCDFGAFIDLGGLEGLIHISELSWGRVAHPSSILERGKSVEAYVLEVDRQAGRIALSLKRLRPDPWKTVNERYTLGQIVEGVVTNVVDFGAFACIEEGLEGLIHVSELAEGHFLHPRNVVNEGQHIRARILTINGTERRLGLSLRLL